MKVLCANAGLVTDVEALELLREREAPPVEAGPLARRLREANQAARRCEEYLENAPTGRQSVDSVAACVDALQGKGALAQSVGGRDLGLRPIERLMVANLAPDSADLAKAIAPNLSGADAGTVLQLAAETLEAAEPSAKRAKS
mmetsp:Transcript_1799/g.5408  ORF Transcript_1799/g.5408 Transcript_1799/m.5408 type:complete len:143 (+) Transcript_1799:217-645(+)